MCLEVVFPSLIHIKGLKIILADVSSRIYYFSYDKFVHVYNVLGHIYTHPSFPLKPPLLSLVTSNKLPSSLHGLFFGFICSEFSWCCPKVCDCEATHGIMSNL